ncbi:bifunctional 3-deoxy-7-phosphoheptulonate synthase/chorismate mutase, partial [Paenibacillus macerans]
MSEALNKLRQKLDAINDELLRLLNERAAVVREIGEIKEKQGVPKFDPVRERAMLEELTRRNPGPFKDAAVKHIFKEIFKASLNLQEEDHTRQLIVSRKKQPEDTVLDVKGNIIGGSSQVMVAGPCSVESYEQLRTVAAALKAAGVKIMRGGAYKPRTSPYDFQGLGVDGLKMLKEVADEFGLATISEIVHPAHIELAERY